MGLHLLELGVQVRIYLVHSGKFLLFEHLLRVVVRILFSQFGLLLHSVVDLVR